MSVPAASPAPAAPQSAIPNVRPAAKGRASGLTFRALLLGLLFTALTDLWIHWAELILGGRGHTALGGTAIPVGAFNVLFLLTIVNLFLTRFLKPLAFSAAERLVIYVMMTVSTVISSSGGIHFVVPTVAAAFYYADNSNGWAGKFHQYIPDWIAAEERGRAERLLYRERRRSLGVVADADCGVDGLSVAIRDGVAVSGFAAAAAVGGSGTAVVSDGGASDGTDWAA